MAVCVSIFGIIIPQFLLLVVQAQLNLPDDLDLYCTGCEAVINEAHKVLSRKSQEPMEVRVMELMDDFCLQENFKTYEYIPPKIEKACQHLMDNHDEEVERLLIEHYTKGASKKVVERRICNKISGACAHVDKTKRKKQSMTAKVVMDGEEKNLKFEQGKPMELNKGKTSKRKSSKSKKEL